MLTDAAAASRRQATRRIVVMMVAGLAIPRLCFALLYATGGALRAELRAVRASFERLRDRPALAALASNQDLSAQDLRAIDASLARLGFPKPNPMLAE